MKYDNIYKKLVLVIFQVGRHKFDLINHHFKLEFVDSGVYLYSYYQDENNLTNPLLQVGSESESNKKVINSDPDPVGQKSTEPDPHPWYKHK